MPLDLSADKPGSYAWCSGSLPDDDGKHEECDWRTEGKWSTRDGTAHAQTRLHIVHVYEPENGVTA